MSGTGPAAAPELFAITVVFELAPGAEEAFLALVRANAAASVREEPGCLRFDVLSPKAAEDGRVLLYEIYRSAADFDAHLATDHFRDFDRLTRDLVRSKMVQAFSVEENCKTTCGA